MNNTTVEIRIMRFWAAVDQSGGPESCWLWTKSTASHGYGQATDPWTGYSTVAPRLAWILTNGDPGTHISPQGNETKNKILHRCPGGPNRLCCNPSHLAIGSDKVNADDREKDGNTFRGEMVTIARLTDQNVAEARRLRRQGWGLSELARRYDVARGTITPAVKGLTWAHVSEPPVT